MINQERIKNLLLEFVQIDSHSRKERDIAERIKKYCEEIGAQCEIDDAGEKVGRSQQGNQSGRIVRAANQMGDQCPGEDGEGPPHGQPRSTVTVTGIPLSGAGGRLRRSSHEAGRS